jgi:hypothetical protein
MVHANFLAGSAHTREDRKFLHCSGKVDSSLPANPARKVIPLNLPQPTLVTPEGTNECEIHPSNGRKQQRPGFPAMLQSSPLAALPAVAQQSKFVESAAIELGHA